VGQVKCEGIGTFYMSMMQLTLLFQHAMPFIPQVRECASKARPADIMKALGTETTQSAVLKKASS